MGYPEPVAVVGSTYNVIAAQLVKASGEKVELRANMAPLLDSMAGGSTHACPMPTWRLSGITRVTS